MTSAVRQARTYFHLMPDDVFEQWLEDVVAERGWPAEDYASALPPEWQAIFMNQPLRYWKNVTWTLQHLTFDEIPFDSLALEKAALIVRAANTGEQVFRAPIENSAARLESCLDYLEENQTLPRPLVCIAAPDGQWHLVDGHHRVAALIGSLHPDELDEFTVSVWVGLKERSPAENAA
jgi:hypothetical protein